MTGEWSRFAEVCEALAATAGKLEKRRLMAEYLRSLPVHDAGRVALYLAGTPFAETDTRQLSVGGASLSRAVAELSGADTQAMTAAYRKHGDLGAAAGELLHGRVGQGVSLADVDTMLAAVAEARGPQAKLRTVMPVLERMSGAEVKYMLKLMTGDMRTGVKQSLVEEAIGAAWERPLADVRHAGMLLGDLPGVVERAMTDSLGEARMRLFHPLGFMLASPVDSVDEAMKRFAEEVEAEAKPVPKRRKKRGASDDVEALETEEISEGSLAEPRLREAQLEDKYDGIRAQLHAGDTTQVERLGLFSRSREDLRAAFPELVEAFAAFPEAVILDGEILAWKDGRALPFSSLQQRLGRKVVSEELRNAVPVVFMAFDVLYADGRLLLDLPLVERRERLELLIRNHADTTRGGVREGQQKLFVEAEAGDAAPRLMLAPAVVLQSGEQLDAAYSEARTRGNEGVMLKARGSLYQPGRRGLAWLKLKRELSTLDVVVTGAEWGHGRRAGYLSDYTFAVRGSDGELLNVGKAYSGVTDAEMHALSAHFVEQTLEDFGHFRTVTPDTMFEVSFNNITRSDRHASGFALRFPRIVRIRTDKPLEEIDTLARVEEIYESQPDKPVS